MTARTDMLPETLRRWTMALARSLSLLGILIGTLFFAASLTPSLLPRTFAQQGILSGCSFAAGYCVGVFVQWLWFYLELPPLNPRHRRGVYLAVLAACAATVIGFLWEASAWQNSIRVLMLLPPVESARPIEVGMIAGAVFGAILLVSRLFVLILDQVSGRLKSRIPRRIANTVGAAIAIAIFWTAIDGLLFKGALRMVDASFQRFDALIEADVDRPSDPLRTGSEASLIGWQELGRTGRQFVSAGPRAGDIAQATDQAMDPIRVYVGLNSAETVQERAQLALEELIRVGAFEREVMVLITPTGTGMVDAAAIDTLEYLHRGDVASVAMQYSYLTSWLSLLFEPGYGAEAARALFRAVYDHWTALDTAVRPRLYLYGLSLGALNSDRSADMFEVVGDPFHGALWTGAPFSTITWGMATEERLPASPAWLPRFRDGSVIRFANQDGLAVRDAPWGAMRIVFLQYASDPVTFFRPDAFFRVPGWMDRPRGPDVSESFRWFPVVTQLQLLLDMALATTTPPGFGHVYAAEHHIEPWMEVTEPQGWDAEGLARLATHLAARRQPPPE